MIYKYTCEHCKKDFNSKRPRTKAHIYCSKQCELDRRRTGTTYQCETCNKSFYRPKNGTKWNSKFCSRKCYYLAGPLSKHTGTRTGKYITCQTCNSKFYAPPYQIKSGRKYCSKKCTSIGIKGPRHRNKPPLVVLCQNCNKTFEKYPSRTRSKFCSPKCQTEYYKVEKVCPNCNKTFHIIRSRNFKLFCSQKCYSEYKNGENNPNWKGGIAFHDYGPEWREQSEKTRKRDDYTCQVCGLNQKDCYRALDVHHITPFAKFKRSQRKAANNLKNLITLCHPCHIKVESGVIPCP